MNDPHAVAYRYGSQIFGFDGHHLPVARGLLIGEASGLGNPRLPLFPTPNSSADRLRKHAGLSPQEWLGLLRRVNACRELPWVDDNARLQRRMIERWLRYSDNFADGAPLRVLLLGRKVQKIWDIRDMRSYGDDGFGVTSREYTADRIVLQIAWIPHPSGLNHVYNDPAACVRAGRVVQWAAGLRGDPL